MQAGKVTGGISDTHFGSRPGLSAIDALMITLTAARDWLSRPLKINKRSKGPAPPKPSMTANDIEGAYNCVVHQRLEEIMRDYKFPTCLSGSIKNYLFNRTISLSFDKKIESPKPFLSGLPQGSPLSPVLFILYSSALTVGHLTSLQTETCYVDDEIMTQGAQSTEGARRELLR